MAKIKWVFGRRSKRMTDYELWCAVVGVADCKENRRAFDVAVETRAYMQYLYGDIPPIRVELTQALKEKQNGKHS